MARKKPLTSLQTGIATLGPAPEPSTKALMRGDDPRLLSPAVVTYRRVLAQTRAPILSPRQLTIAATGVFGRSAASAAPSADAGLNKILPDDLSAVLEFARRPVLANAVHENPLPVSIVRLMRIAAGSPEALQHAVRLTGKDPIYLRAAIIYYLEQALWTEPRDPFRVLGATADTPRDELAERVRWLMAWLHPYLGGSEPEARFADQVLRAWLTIRNPPDRGAGQSPSIKLDSETKSNAPSRSIKAQPASASSIGTESPSGRAYRHRRVRVRWSVAALALVGLGTIAAIAGSGGSTPFLHGKGVAGLIDGASATSIAKTESQLDPP